MSHRPLPPQLRTRRFRVGAAAAVLAGAVGIGAATAQANTLEPLVCGKNRSYTLDPIMATSNGNNFRLVDKRFSSYLVSRAEIAETGQVVVQGSATGDQCTWVGPSGNSFVLWGTFR